MATIEQAIFTSAETASLSGYQLVVASPGVSEADAKELTVWGPSHDSLVDSGPGASSFNFHALPSGSYCISRTAAAGQEYSQRGGPRVFTHCLVVGADVLARFANNPFALYRAVSAGRSLFHPESIPQRLDPLEVVGRAAAVDQVLLARLAARPGPQWMGTIVQAALDSICLSLAGAAAVEPLIAGLFSCLPPECRPEFSFTTGLKFSIQRPFRVVGYPGPAASLQAFQHRYNLTVLDLEQAVPQDKLPLEGWGRLIEQILAVGRASFLATQFSKRRFDLSLDDLPALGLQLMESLDGSALRDEPVEKQVPPDDVPDGAGVLQRAHAPHRRSDVPAAAATVAPRANAPSKRLNPESPEVLARLEELDDAVFDAIGGKTAALDMLKSLWPKVRDELGDELVAESREQYLRYALSIWEEYVGSGGVRNPARAVQALDVLCILFDKV